MTILGYLFPIIAALAAWKLWNTEYKSVSSVFAGDFVVLFAVVSLWMESSLPEGIWFLPNLGIVYITLFIAYLLTKSNIGYAQAGLSAFIGIIHCANPILGWLTLENYTPVMIVYCLCQFAVFFGGISYELYHRNIPINAWFNPNSHWNKGA